MAPRRTARAIPSASASSTIVGELVPLDEERVVALDRADLAVAGVRAGRPPRRRRAPGPGRRRTGCRPGSRRPVTPVPAAASARYASTIPPRSRPTSWPSMIRTRTRYVSGSNRSSSLRALVVEVRGDREPAVGLAAPAEPVVEVRLGAVGRHRELARELQAALAERVDRLELDVVPRDRHRAGRGGRRHRQQVVDRIRPLERDLLGDHPAQRAAGDEHEPPDAEPVGERPQRPGLVARGGLGEGGAVRRARSPGRRTSARSSRIARRAGSRTGRRPGSCRAPAPAR